MDFRTSYQDPGADTFNTINMQGLTLDKDGEIYGQASSSEVVDIISFDHIKNINDTLTFLEYILPNIGRKHNLTANMNPSQPNK